jgi:hypothetical protein
VGDFSNGNRISTERNIQQLKRHCHEVRYSPRSCLPSRRLLQPDLRDQFEYLFVHWQPEPAEVLTREYNKKRGRNTECYGSTVAEGPCCVDGLASAESSVGMIGAS